MTQNRTLTNGIASGGGDDRSEENVDEERLIPRSLNDDIRVWNLDDVGRWLRLSGYEEFVG